MLTNEARLHYERIGRLIARGWRVVGYNGQTGEVDMRHYSHNPHLWDVSRRIRLHEDGRIELCPSSI